MVRKKYIGIKLMFLEGIVYKSTGSWYLVKCNNDFFECRIKGKIRLKDLNDYQANLLLGSLRKFFNHTKFEFLVFVQVIEQNLPLRQ